MLRTLPALFTILCALAPAFAAGDVRDYVRKADPAYQWHLNGKTSNEMGEIYDISMTSQVWEGITWKHHMQVFRPAKLRHANFCSVLNTGGSGSSSETRMGQLAAMQSGANFAILFDIPNQPLFGGLTEDGLIVYTWQKYLETGDADWPLHFPMAKSVIKAIDTVQALARHEKLPPVTGFLVTGASKRGWTTWLAGATQDRRIKAIAPMVIDTLNMVKQLPHQLEAYGVPSEQIDDYTRSGMLQKLRTPEGQKLVALEDPYSYRDRLTLPKLLILGTNDRYWAQDALNLYWDDLKGPKYVTYTPNSGHGLEDRLHVFATLTAFIDDIAGGVPFPQMHWTYEDSADGGTLRVTSDHPIVAARLFHVESATKDFRDSKWTYTDVTPDGTGFTTQFTRPATGYQAIFGEAQYNYGGHTFTLSTQIKILSAK